MQSDRPDGQDSTGAGWSFGKTVQVQEWQGSRTVQKQAEKVAIKAYAQAGQAGIGNTGRISAFGRQAITE